MDPPRQKGHRAARVRDQDPEARVAVEDAGEEHAREGDGGFHGEAEGEGEHVAVFGRAGAVDGGREAVVRVQEGEGLVLGERGPDGVEGGVVEAGA